MNNIINSISEIIDNLGDSKRIILVGKGASGKDFARKQLESLGFKYQISYTTRPARTGEIHGKDYYFISKKEFAHMIKSDMFYEFVFFNNWYYGTERAQMKADRSVFIMTPSGIDHLHPDDRDSSLIVYFDIDQETRRERLQQRQDADKVERRLEADEKDFKYFTDFDLKITNPNYK